MSLKEKIEKSDLIVVGAGLYGATIAERVTSELGKRVLIIEKRGHIGGNAYSEIDQETGIDVHKYGAHIFHTSNIKVWDYVRRFSEFTNYSHRVFTSHEGNVYSMPINLGTICQFFGKRLSPLEAKNLIEEHSRELGGRRPSNLEEKAISLIGRPLYEAFIRGYTKKQWQTDPLDLPEGIITRLPVRYNFDNRYFNDVYEGIPSDGYGKLFENMLNRDGIEVVLGVDFFDLDRSWMSSKPIVYTGPIDRWFNYSYGRMGWRTVDLKQETLDVEDFQGTSVMNYADEHVPYTRILEFKHFNPEKKYKTNKTIIVREFSRFANDGDDPYYPIDTAEDKRKYLIYKEMAAEKKLVHFGGRLGTYRYWDMHQAIGAALKAYEDIYEPYFNRT